MKTMKNIKNIPYVCKGCPACHYCDASACNSWHCGYATLFGFDEYKLDCKDNSSCLMKKIASLLIQVSQDPRYAMKALPIVHELSIDYIDEDESLMERILHKLNHIKEIFKAI